MAERKQTQDLLLSLAFLLFVGLVLLILVFEQGRGLDPNYVSLFSKILGACLGIGVIAVLYTAIKRPDSDEYSPLPISTGGPFCLATNIWFKLGGATILIIIFCIGLFVTEHSIIPIINPYEATSIVTSNTPGVSGSALTGARSGLFAGVGEDTAGFLFVLIGTLLLLLLVFNRFDEESTQNPALVFFALFIMCCIWALLFATAHKLAYGLDSKAYVGAAFYGFLSQLTNGIVGAPVSIIAHFLHNFFAIFLKLVSYSTMAIAPALIPFFGGLPMKHSRKGNAAAIGLVVLIAIAAIAGTIWYSTDKTLSIANPSCTDYIDVPQTTACTNTDSCIAQMVPEGKQLDDGITVRCNNGICQAKIAQCTSVVTP